MNITFDSTFHLTFMSLVGWIILGILALFCARFIIAAVLGIFGYLAYAVALLVGYAVMVFKYPKKRRY